MQTWHARRLETRLGRPGYALPIYSVRSAQKRVQSLHAEQALHYVPRFDSISLVSPGLESIYILLLFSHMQASKQASNFALKKASISCCHPRNASQQNDQSH